MEERLSPINDPGMIVRVVSPEGHAKTWTLPQSLLMCHSRYFRRIKNFREATAMKVELADTEPQIFELFIQFLYCGKYIDKDNLDDHSKVRDSTKAWVLGDYLDAPGFKRLAIRELCNIYLPEGKGLCPRSGFGLETIDFCCRNSTADNLLHQFYLGITGRFWGHNKIVHLNDCDGEAWNAVWEEHPHFRNELFAKLFFHAGKKLKNEIHKMRAFALALEVDKQ